MVGVLLLDTSQLHEAQLLENCSSVICDGNSVELSYFHQLSDQVPNEKRADVVVIRVFEDQGIQHVVNEGRGFEVR